MNQPSVLWLRDSQVPEPAQSGVKDHKPWSDGAWSPKRELVPAKPVYRAPVLPLTQMPPSLRLGTPRGFGLERRVTEALVQSVARSIETRVFAVVGQRLIFCDGWVMRAERGERQGQK